MSEVHKKGLDAVLVQNDLESCCRGKSSCVVCQGADCTIGYAKQCIHNYIQTPPERDSGRYKPHSNYGSEGI